MYLALTFLLVGLAAGPTPTPTPSSVSADVVALGFSPGHSCTQIEIDLVGRAQKEVLVQVYGFSSQAVAEALDGAEVRGVDVKVIMDRSNLHQKSSERLDLELHHVPVWIDARHAIAHNKITIVDGRFVETGSFNYTHQGERNAENCIVLDSRELAGRYRANWLQHQAHSLAESADAPPKTKSTTSN